MRNLFPLKHILVGFGLTLPILFSCSISSTTDGPNVTLRDQEVTETTTTLTNSSTRYVVSSNIQFTGNVTIGPDVQLQCNSNGRIKISGGDLRILSGSVLRMAPDCYIEIQEDARILVEGTEEDSVLFTSLDGDHWGYGSSDNFSGGIWIEYEAATGNSIEYAIIDDAKTAIYSDRENGLSISNSRISNTQYHGIFLDALTLDTLNHLKFTEIGLYDIRTEPSDVIHMGDSLMQDRGILIEAGEAASISGTWPNAQYQVTGRMIIGDEESRTTVITLTPGSRFQFTEDAYFDIGTQGRLLSVGTPQDSIYMSAAEGTGKQWGYGTSDNFSGGIWFGSDAASGSKIAYTVIDSANNAVYSDRENGLTITNSRISNSKFYGVYADPLTLTLLDSSVIESSGIYDIRVEPSDIIRLGANLQLESGVHVQPGEAAALTGTWPALYYLVEGRVILGGATNTTVITIAPGAELRFNEEAYMDITTRARIIAEGTTANPIHFEPAEQGKFWGYGSSANFSGSFWFDDDAASGSSFENVVIDSAKVGIRNTSTTTITISNSTISDYQFWAIYDTEGAVTTTDVTMNSSVATAVGDHFIEP